MQIIFVKLIKIQIFIEIFLSTIKFKSTLSEPNLGDFNVNKVTPLLRQTKRNMADERACVNIIPRQVIDLFEFYVNINHF
jgi:hypothetical protein